MESEFAEFVERVGARVERALVAMYGVEIGVDAAADAMAVAWERWAEISAMANPAGYLFRVGQSRTRRNVRWARSRASFPASYRTPAAERADDGSLLDVYSALARLRPEQRVAVVMVRSYGFSYRETADVLGTSEAAVSAHLRRGMARLRLILEVDRDRH